MDQAQLGKIALSYIQDWLTHQYIPVGPENVALAARIMRAADVTQHDACTFLANPCSGRIAFCFMQDLLQYQEVPAGPENKILVAKIAKIAAVDESVAEAFLIYMRDNYYETVWQ